MVEWADAAPRLLNLDYAAKMVVIDRSQAIVEFSTDGTIVDANTNFLSGFGYELHEVKGRHHGMFVEPASWDSCDFAAFWSTLRSGQYQSAQFKRIGKNGKTVRIESSYNPILDETGKVTKVVKSAADVTSQMTLLADLQTLIDRNFGEIDSVMERCAARAASASVASDETSGNVRRVAGSASELAASIGEIAPGPLSRGRLQRLPPTTTRSLARASAGSAADDPVGLRGC